MRNVIGATLLFLAIASLEVAHCKSLSPCQIDGYVKYQGILGDARVPFAIEINDCLWIMSLTNGPTDYFQIGFDGKDVDYLDDLQNAVATKKAQGLKTGDNVATANVIRGQIPHFPFGAAHCSGPIWLTYASGCYFETLSGDYAEPAVSVSVPSASGMQTLFPGDSVLQRVYLSWENGALKVPTSVVYFVSTNPASGRAYPAPLEHGFTNCAFRVTATTNWHDLTVPLKAEIKVFGIYAVNGEPAGSRLMHTYAVMTERIEWIKARSDYRPVIPGLTAFADARFVGGGKPRFSYINARWLNDKEALAAMKFSTATGDIVTVNTSNVRKIIVFVLVVSTLIVLAAFFRIRKKYQ